MMAGEIVGGVLTGSLMLLSDAAHMGSHVLALVVSYGAIRLAASRPGARSHFGLYRAEVLAAFVNGLSVLGFTLFILIEAVDRYQNPVAIAGLELFVIALLGLLVNIATTMLLARTGASDLNTRSAMVHMLGDLLSSVAVVAGAAVLLVTGWAWVDLVLSVLVALLILVWGVGLLRDAGGTLLELSPIGVDIEDVRRTVLREVPAVRDLHDVHLWDITSGYRCVTAHVVVAEQGLSESVAIREAVASVLGERFGVVHATLQLEAG